VPYNAVAVTAEDQLVGQVGGTTLDGGRAELLSLWVAPEARGAGVGEALVEAVCRWAATDAAAIAVRLSVRRTNDPAIRLYERTGFRHADPDTEPGDEPAELAMVRTLHPQA
jgi:ribosomal protein S18 acetylase RimI-like enzyme